MRILCCLDGTNLEQVSDAIVTLVPVEDAQFSLCN